MFSVKLVKTPGCTFTVKKMTIKQMADDQKLEFD